MHSIIPFQKRKPSDIEPYIDFEKRWKFTEDDKDFLIAYYEDWVQGCIDVPMEILLKILRKYLIP